MLANKLSHQLRAGDKVALIAPASGQKKDAEDFVQQAIDLLQSWGLDVVIRPVFNRHSRYLASEDQRRAESLIAALTHPEVRAVFVTRGGYGCARLLPFLNGVKIPSWRFLVGFSDVTSLHLHFSQTPEIINLHSPNLATQGVLNSDSCALGNRQALKDALFAGELPAFSLKPLNPRAKLTSVDEDKQNSLLDFPKTGGCLSLLVTSLGTADEINTDDKVLMIEEVGESPYKIDRMLTHLKNAGKFQQVKAIVFGEMLNCNSPNIEILEVLSEYFNDADFPVYHCSTFGHGQVNLPWLYDAK